MSLEETIRDIQKKIQNDEYPNEQAISLGIVVRLLREQNWPVNEPQVVIPEYSVQGKRVDYALCVNNKPKIFIEVKQPGKTQGADEQVFQYAYHQGIPFAIVTDGRAWHFYLPTAEGSYEERRVYTLDLVERTIEESAARLNRYLSFDEVKNGNALRNAQDDYENVSRERRANANIPSAWDKLLEEKDETLVGVISDKVENLCGYAPTQKQIIAHLTGLKLPVIEKSHSRERTKTDGFPMQRKTSTRVKIRVTFPNGTVIYDNQVAQTLIKVIQKIGFRKVQSLNLFMFGSNNMVSQQKPGAEWTDVGHGFFVCTQSSTSKKLNQLNEINDRLGLGLKIEGV